MADTKISEFTPAVSLSKVDILPIVQTGANKFATLGQVASLVNTRIVTVSNGTAAAPTSDIVLISGTVTLASGTDTKEIILISTAAGTLEVILQGIPTIYTYVASGDTITLIWANSTWNVISLYGMV